MGGGPQLRQVVDRTKNHVVAIYDDVVITYAYKRSVDDPLHVTATGRAVVATSLRTGKPVTIVFVIADAETAQAPSAAVREAITTWGRNNLSHVARMVTIIPGHGIGSSIHRSVVRAIAVMFMRSVKVEVVDSLREAFMRHSLTGAALDDAVAFCDQIVDRRVGGAL